MKLLFHHIPKTAGTALIEHGQAIFGDRVCAGRYDDQVGDDDILDERILFYHGHFTRRFVLRFRSLVPDALIFTFLRHPFERTLSQYYNWTDVARVERELALIAASSSDQDRLAQVRKMFEAKMFGRSLEEFLLSRDPDVLQGTDNVQCQYMTPAESKPHHLRFNGAALNAIGFYDFIGLQELYGPCLRILEKKCGLEPGSFGGDVRSNASDYAKPSGRYRVTSREMALLERRSTFDLVLFHVCHAQLVKLYADWLPPTAFDLDRLVAMPEIAPRDRRRRSVAAPGDARPMM